MTPTGNTTRNVVTFLLHVPQKASQFCQFHQYILKCSPQLSAVCRRQTSDAALTGGEYLCRWSLLGFEGCLRLERDDRAKQKVNVLLELQS